MKKEIAQQLLNIEAVFLKPNDPFTWSSGLKSPIYCDNRLTISYPEVRRMIAQGIAENIKNHFPDADMIAGTATAGIPHAAWVSEILDLPMCYVRSKPKGHGKGSQIEGKVSKGQKVVVVEDLISTGGSCISAVNALREEGCEVLGVAAIFTYELQSGISKLAEADIKAVSLSDYTSLLEAAHENNYIEERDLEALISWKESPEEWGKNL
ncbi:orotate phosphoribosyltransferase [Rossellomorea vietnamensis]|uniref:Orotate phosphoribosyltransferase n=1 Tax=Rossellomorea vietnamensis TaxID=218284 RepID=A0A5D4KJW2_9BACI|nr:orotate phosphoribosyltransferase [Rossellomorea vietnamensis]TYR77584.1 orotate phosphoribosyltransferase [Rossellomorea vietnamensis]